MVPITYEEFLERVRDGSVSHCGNCPLKPFCLKLQSKWKPQISYLLCIHKRMRFSQLKRELGDITNSTLAASLREMEADGFIRREQFNEMPPRVEYTPTDMGADLLPIFYQIMLWNSKHGQKLDP